MAPDTSPRGANIPGEDDSWDFGTGAGFYVDATQNSWETNYRMYSYIVNEIPALLAREFSCLDSKRVGITGHSMGGHGALTIALKNQSNFKYNLDSNSFVFRFLILSFPKTGVYQHLLQSVTQ